MTAVLEQTATAEAPQTETPKPQPPKGKAAAPKADAKAAKTEAPETPNAPVPQGDSRYAEPKVAGSLAERVKAARAAGFSRTTLQAETELTPAQLWRIENGRAHRHEVAQLVAVLDKIDAGELQPPQKPGKVSETQTRLNAVKRVLEEAHAGLTKAAILEKVAEAIAALEPQPEPAEPSAA